MCLSVSTEQVSADLVVAVALESHLVAAGGIRMRVPPLLLLPIGSFLRIVVPSQDVLRLVLSLCSTISLASPIGKGLGYGGLHLPIPFPLLHHWSCGVLPSRRLESQ